MSAQTVTAEEVAKYLDDPVTLAAFDLHQLVASWPVELRDEVVETFGTLAIICATRGAPEHHAAAEYLTLARRLIRAVGEAADNAQTERGATHGNQA